MDRSSTINPAGTGDLQRDKCRQAIFRALKSTSSGDQASPPTSDMSPASLRGLADIAAMTENAIFKTTCSNQVNTGEGSPYRNSIMSHASNLRLNPELKSQLASGAISAETFAGMNHEAGHLRNAPLKTHFSLIQKDMATPQRRIQIAEIRREINNEAWGPASITEGGWRQSRDQDITEWGTGVHEADIVDTGFSRGGILQPRHDDRTGRGHRPERMMVSGFDDDAQSSLL
ncbi:hypothetical protein HDV00_010432 [Rhizophlyctis rosea]|nr:hypothetical protein HDV00_010432 [Rhizophlyctis rosea]